MLAKPAIVSLWSDAVDDTSLLCSGWLINGRDIVTVKHALDGSDEVFVGLLDGVHGRRQATAYQKHAQHDLAVLRLHANVDGGPAAPPLLDEYVSLAGQTVCIHTVSPIGPADRQVFPNYAIGSYDESDRSWILAPENARGHSGGIVTSNGVVVGLLWARAKNDPLCKALSMHEVWPWLEQTLSSALIKASSGSWLDDDVWSFSLPQNATFRAVARVLANEDGAVCSFHGFTDEQLGSRLRPQKLRVNGVSGALYVLRLLAATTEIPDYDVTGQPPEYHLTVRSA